MIQIHVVHIDCSDFKLVIGRVIIDSTIRIATAAVVRIFKAIGRPNTPLWHRNGIQNVKELIYIGAFGMLRYRIFLYEKGSDEP